MKYASSAAFRRALEDRLRAHSQQTALPLIRLRKLVAFDRLLARLTIGQPATWILKAAWHCNSVSGRWPVRLRLSIYSCGWPRAMSMKRWSMRRFEISKTGFNSRLLKPK